MVSLARSSWNSGTVVISAAALACSFISLQVKLFTEPVPPAQVTLVSSGSCWLLTSIWLATNYQHSNSSTTGSHNISTSHSPKCLVWPNKRVLALLILRGILGAIAVGCFYAAVELLPLQDAVTLFFCNPAFAVLLDSIVSWRLPQPSAVVACIFTILGVILIGRDDCVMTGVSQQSWLGLRSCLKGLCGSRQQQSQQAMPMPDMHGLPLAGVLLALVAAFANAASFVTVTSLGTSVSSLLLTWWHHMIVTLVSLLACLVTEPYLLQWPSEQNWVLLGGISAANFAGQILLNRGFQLADASRGSALNTAQVLYSYIWSVALLHGSVTHCAVLGSVAIVLGVFSVTCGNRKDVRVQTRVMINSRPEQLPGHVAQNDDELVVLLDEPLLSDDCLHNTPLIKERKSFETDSSQE
eukprot:jgi/Chrzof1/2216/Cz11g07020.t1